MWRGDMVSTEPLMGVALSLSADPCLRGLSVAALQRTFRNRNMEHVRPSQHLCLCNGYDHGSAPLNRVGLAPGSERSKFAKFTAVSGRAIMACIQLNLGIRIVDKMSTRIPVKVNP